MPRCSRKDSHRLPTCSCLLEAYRTFPAAESGKGCASPDCPVRTLDGITLHQFLEAIGGGPEEPGGDVTGTAEDSKNIPIFRAVAQRRTRRKSKRVLD